MRSERPLHLDVGVSSGNAFQTQPETSSHADSRSQQQLADQAHNLRELLQQQRSAPTPEPTAAAASPFDLFRPAPAAPTPNLAGSAQEAPAALGQALEQMANRLLVGDGSQGRRAVQIQLSDDQLRGVVVDIFEESGRLVSCFTCSNEESRERLNSGASWFADKLAQRLQRDTRVEVQTDDPEDRCLLQVDANY